MSPQRLLLFRVSISKRRRRRQQRLLIEWHTFRKLSHTFSHSTFVPSKEQANILRLKIIVVFLLVKLLAAGHPEGASSGLLTVYFGQGYQGLDVFARC